MDNSLPVSIFWHDPQNQFYTNLIGDLDIKWGNMFLFPELLASLPGGLARPTLIPMGFNH